MAVKLMNVKGAVAGGVDAGSHDLVMLTSKEFIAGDADDYLSLHRALNGAAISLAWHFLTHLRDLGIVRDGQREASNPLQLEYFSSVPYKLGPRSMKFKARPCASSSMDDGIPIKPTHNYLRERLVETLKANAVCYELLVQPNMDPGRNDVEKANVAWDEERSPYVKVATINIPQQEKIDHAAHLNFCENIGFDPWRAYPETRPLGQINRVRLIAYLMISKFRHGFNNTQMVEPVSHDICLDDKDELCRAPKH